MKKSRCWDQINDFGKRNKFLIREIGVGTRGVLRNFKPEKAWA
jgi:hypothetical protein